MHIVLLHTLRASWFPPPVARLFSWGGSTASLFFILSGFLLAHAYAAPGGMRIPRRTFWMRRLARLYPLAILCHLLAAPLVWSGYAPGERWMRAAATVAGVQAWWPPFANSFDSPGWSLSYLAFGYLLLPSVLRLCGGWSPRRLAACLAVLWAACLAPAIAWTVIAPASPVWRVALFTHPVSRLPEFLFGAVLALLLASRPWREVDARVAPSVLLAIVLCLAFLPAGLFALNHQGLLAPLHAVLIWSLARGTGPMQRMLSTRMAARLGGASFGIYLLHVPLYAWMLRILSTDVSAWGLGASAAFYATYLVLTVALGWAAERWIVVPLARMAPASAPRGPRRSAAAA
jgi:peptidoglycan/LPS O-acetylase OafA/YrhL